MNHHNKSRATLPEAPQACHPGRYSFVFMRPKMKSIQIPKRLRQEKITVREIAAVK